MQAAGLFTPALLHHSPFDAQCREERMPATDKFCKLQAVALLGANPEDSAALDALRGDALQV